jgi:cation diffusion facilitator CzcD-associated flavoprotein CzcO/acetyl esterase/lipase
MKDQADLSEQTEVDAVVVGAGFSGLYMIHRLRQLGRSVIGFEAASDVGGTWYWNRYPGARCDIPTTDYGYSFDPELEVEWTWTEKYATQPEILAYLRHAADRYDLRRDIRFSTRVLAAQWDEGERRWHIRTDQGDQVACRFFIMATGCLSVPKEPDIEGADQFSGESYFTGRWPHEGVDFTGKRVAVIGTGSSGIQSIPVIAAQAAQLTVFQRTASFSFPALNGPPSAERLAMLSEDREGYRAAARYSRRGIPFYQPTDLRAKAALEGVGDQRFEAAWGSGELFASLNIFADQAIDLESNETVAELYRAKIRSIVSDPETAEALCPKSYPLGTKRPCLDTGYFETFNLPHVRLVDLRTHPITSITPRGIDTGDESLEFDVIVFATGFDAMTGALFDVDITGVEKVPLRDKWADGPSTYLGLTTRSFPNLFMITGPGSPSVLSNMALSIEQHVEWVADCTSYMAANGFDRIEPTETAEAGWNQHVQDCAAITLYPLANSWYMGANVPGKPRVFYPYIGGIDVYRKTCEEVAAGEYLGFSLSGSAGRVCRDGVVRQLQPDVAMVVEAMEALELPALQSMTPAETREFAALSATRRPPGPDVAEIVEAKLPGPGGELPYRLYRPAGHGPHPIMAYFHGGGWVLGDLDSDDPLCRDLCVRCGALVLSINYRHAPEARFPAAPDDALAAITWISSHAAELGGIRDQLVVAGWSAGANIAAVAAQLARDAGEPRLAGQVLLSPVTDCDLTRRSYQENGNGYLLTPEMMDWFWTQYANPEQRTDPRAAPLRGDLSGVAPAVVMTAQFDPLRDEGNAYADALSAAGVPVRHLLARGHIHRSVTMVDAVLSGAPIRAEIAEAVADLFAQSVHA